MSEEKKKLWSAAVGSSHVLPGVLGLDATIQAHQTPGCLPMPACLPTYYERLDVALPGDLRRAAVAGVVAGLAAAKESGKEVLGHFVQVVAVHANSGRSVTLPAALVAGSRFDFQSSKPSVLEGPLKSHQLLSVVVGLGARHVLPGPRAKYPAGSLEVRTGLAFLGPDGGWLHGGAIALAALLEAAVAWSASEESR